MMHFWFGSFISGFEGQWRIAVYCIYARCPSKPLIRDQGIGHGSSSKTLMHFGYKVCVMLWKSARCGHTMQQCARPRRSRIWSYFCNATGNDARDNFAGGHTEQFSPLRAGRWAQRCIVCRTFRNSRAKPKAQNINNIFLLCLAQ
jgi:hypothetical protein